MSQCSKIKAMTFTKLLNGAPFVRINEIIFLSFFISTSYDFSFAFFSRSKFTHAVLPTCWKSILRGILRSYTTARNRDCRLPKRQIHTHTHTHTHAHARTHARMHPQTHTGTPKGNGVPSTTRSKALHVTFITSCVLAGLPQGIRYFAVCLFGGRGMGGGGVGGGGVHCSS